MSPSSYHKHCQFNCIAWTTSIKHKVQMIPDKGTSKRRKNQTEITFGTIYGRTKQATSNARTLAYAHVCTCKHNYDPPSCFTRQSTDDRAIKFLSTISSTSCPHSYEYTKLQCTSERKKIQTIYIINKRGKKRRISILMVAMCRISGGQFTVIHDDINHASTIK